MRGRKWIFGPVVGAVLGLSLAQGALACAFHGYTPNPTLVDLLLNTEQAALARPARGGAAFEVLETLAGQPVPQISVAPSAEARRRLSRDPAAAALLVRDGAYGPWMELAVLDSRYRGVIEEVLSRQSDWQLGADTDRLRLFGGLVNDPNDDLRRLALQELDRAPYASLQKLRLPAVQGLRADLVSGEADLMPIRVLLAGLSRDAAFVPLLRAQMDQALRADVAYLGAYATALIELAGPEAVELIVTGYLAAGGLTDTQAEKLMQALAIQYRAAPRGTRRLIAAEVAKLSRSSPVLADIATRQFGFGSAGQRGRPGQAERNSGSASAPAADR